MSRETRNKVNMVWRYVILLAVGVVMVYPLVWMIGASLPHCQVMNSRKRQPQRKIFVAAVLIGGLKQKNPRLYQGNKNFSIA